MHYTIVVVMRIMFFAMLLLGLCFFVLLGLLGIIQEVLADEYHQPPPLSNNDSRISQSIVPQVRFYPDLRLLPPINGGVLVNNRRGHICDPREPVLLDSRA
jgi:hypothetical protein